MFLPRFEITINDYKWKWTDASTSSSGWYPVLGALHIKTRPIAEKVSILNCSQTFLGRYHNITSNYGKAWAKNMVKSISNTETSIVVLIILNGNGQWGRRWTFSVMRWSWSLYVLFPWSWRQCWRLLERGLSSRTGHQPHCSLDTDRLEIRRVSGVWRCFTIYTLWKLS